MRPGGLPMCRRRFHIPWHFPYVFAAPPYGHTPDEFPHTFWQIPTGRPFSHSHGRSPIDRPFPHTIHKLQKFGFHFDETSGSSPTNPQPTTSSKHPEPALHLRKPSAGQFQQITHACEWGAPSPPARVCTYLHVLPWSCAHLHGHGHALTFNGTRTAMVIHARPRQRPGTLLTRPAYGSHKSSANPVHSSALRLRHISANQAPIQLTQNAWGAWASTSTTASTTTGGAAACV